MATEEEPPPVYQEDTTELASLWTAAGLNDKGQLGIARDDGKTPNITTNVENFTSINNGELPDGHRFIDIHRHLSDDNTTYLLGSDGRTYVTGELKNGAAEYGVDSFLVEQTPNAPQPRLAESLQSFPDNQEESGGAGFHLDPDGSLWLDYQNADETTSTVQAASGVTYAARTYGNPYGGGYHDCLLLLKDLKLYVIYDFQNLTGSGINYTDNDSGLLRGESFHLVDVSGGMKFKALWAAGADNLYQANIFLIDETDTLWVQGPNRYGQLGVPSTAGGFSVSWTKYVTSSKVEEVVAFPTHTFIKRKE
jgi:hypothetical protein